MQNVKQSFVESLLHFTPALKMEAACSYKILVSMYKTAHSICMCAALETQLSFVNFRILHVFSKFFTVVGELRVGSKTKVMEKYLIKTLVIFFKVT
jgi:hypothetical protein